MRLVLDGVRSGSEASRLEFPVNNVVGRSKELAQLQEAAARAVQDHTCQVMVVRGEAGIGKSTLLNAFSAAVRNSLPGVQVGYGQALSTSADSESYTALRDCLRSLAAGASKDESFLVRLRQALTESAPDWLPAVPVVGGVLAGGAALALNLREDHAPSGGDPTDSPIHQLRVVVESLALQTPLVLILDDLHWADRMTLDAVTTIAMSVQQPILLVLSYRVADMLLASAQGTAERSPLESALYRIQRYLAPEHRYREVMVQPLSDRAVAEIVRSRMGSQQSGDVTQIVSRAAGNPLFAATLAGLPAAERQRPFAADGSVNAITAVLREQLSLLPSTQRKLLECAALIGSVFEIDYLAGLLHLDEDELFNLIGELSENGIFLVPLELRGTHERYRFHHPLLGELLRTQAQANGPMWRRQNARLLDIYIDERAREGRWDDDALVRAVDCARQAGNRAEDCYRLGREAAERQWDLAALPQAIRLARISLEHADESDIHGKLGVARILLALLTAVGDDAACVAQYERLEVPPGMGTSDAIGCATQYARSLRMLARWDDVRRECGALLAGEQGNLDEEERAQVLMLEAEIQLCGPEQDIPGCHKTLCTVLDLSSAPALRARALGHRALAQLACYETDEAEETFAECMAEAMRSGHPYIQFEALHWKSKYAMAVLDLDLATDLLAQLDAISDRHGVARDSRPQSRDASRVLGLQGRSDEAALEYLRYWHQLPPQALGVARATLVLQCGELEDVAGPLMALLLRESLASLVRADTDSRSADLAEALQLLEAGLDLTVPERCLRLLGVTSAEFAMADAIFRFDVPDLNHLRKGQLSGH